MRIALISCKNAVWKVLLEEALQAGTDVNLENFDYTLHGDFCETLAMSHQKLLTIDVKKELGFFSRARPVKG